MKIYIVICDDLIDSIFINKCAADSKAAGVGGYVDEFDTEDRCQTCNFAHSDEFGDIHCCNYEADLCTEYVDRDDYCEKWEGNQ